MAIVLKMKVIFASMSLYDNLCLYWLNFFLDLDLLGQYLKYKITLKPTYDNIEMSVTCFVKVR